MKLSENTFEILKNFATINPSLLVRPGNSIATVAPNRTIQAHAIVEESFPQQFAIYELSKFLGVASLFKEPEIEFSEYFLTMRSGRLSTNYTYADPSTIFAPPDREVNFPGADIEFNITADELRGLIRAAAVLQVPDISVTNVGDKIVMQSANIKTPTTDTYSIEVGETDKNFKMNFKVDVLVKLLSKDYNVKISSRGLTVFSADNLVYYVPNEATSTFGG
jgi:hypothetical protein